MESVTLEQLVRSFVVDTAFKELTRNAALSAFPVEPVERLTAKAPIAAIGANHDVLKDRKRHRRRARKRDQHHADIIRLVAHPGREHSRAAGCGIIRIGYAAEQVLLQNLGYVGDPLM